LEPGIEITMTQAFLREFIRDRRVKVVDRMESDSILEGTVKSFGTVSVSYDQAGQALEYQTTIEMDVTLKRRNGEMIWRDKDLIERTWFQTSPNVLINENNKLAAIQQIGQSLAERIRNRFFYNF
jgi:outer membrane lipopolysaccharide assembly protein LptE/RlpB